MRRIIGFSLLFASCLGKKIDKDIEGLEFIISYSPYIFHHHHQEYREASTIPTTMSMTNVPWSAPTTSSSDGQKQNIKGRAL